MLKLGISPLGRFPHGLCTGDRTRTRLSRKDKAALGGGASACGVNGGTGRELEYEASIVRASA